MNESTQAQVATAVRGVLGAITQAQDAGRTDDVVALYAKDAVLEVPGMGSFEGHDALREAFKGWEPTAPQKHVVANTVIVAISATEATATSDVTFFQRGEAGWAPQVVGRYEDTLRLQDGSWLVQRRVTTYSA
ncbi:nuclear transport factor 2 family protein [Nocardia sp. XZ_19_231]|uniref:nuclear transport factor 2 family protein n=1 Tax=Nocardia sp. XZ_19_231 TaxID=2769252 RepID=UPI001890152C|nr:nuclear transport factor 2 family protein [Nocardia sp. XZ_19_231]